MKLCMPLCVVALAALFVGSVTAQNPAQGKEVQLKGKICCAKCELELTKRCASVIVVKDSGKDVVYYFDTKSNEKYHGEICSKSRPGEITGIVTEAAGKKTISVIKLTYK